jgi:glycosyltransferase involved in cell wall biosynthesis
MNNSAHRSTLVIVPGYNAASHLDELVTRLRAVVTPANVIYVDDGSSDDTSKILERLGIKCLRHPHNLGKGAALRTGFRYARERGFQSVVTMDADLQHPPEAILDFFVLDDGTRLLLGTRAMSAGMMPLARRLSNFLTSLVISVFSGRRVRDSQCGFRLLPVSLLDKIALTSDGFFAESELLMRAGQLGLEICEVPIATVYNGAPSRINHLIDPLRFVRLVFRRLWW